MFAPEVFKLEIAASIKSIPSANGFCCFTRDAPPHESSHHTVSRVCHPSMPCVQSSVQTQLGAKAPEVVVGVFPFLSRMAEALGKVYGTLDLAR